MKKRKGFYILALVVCLTMMITSACGGNDTGKGDSTGDNTISQKGSTAGDEIYNIVICPISQPVDNNGEVVKSMEEMFNCKFEFWNTTGEGAALAVRLAAGEIPDWFHAYSLEYLKYANDELIAEIPFELIKENAGMLYALYEKETPGWQEKTVINGKNYGIPRVLAEGGYARMPVIWRGDWLENVGITKIPETLEEFEEAIYKFKTDDPDRNGKDDTYGLSASGLDALYGAHGYIPTQWSKKDGEYVYGAVQPEMKEALAIAQKWYKDEVLEPEFISTEDRGGVWAISNPFVNGLIGVSCHADYFYWKPALYPGDREGENIRELRNLNPAALEKIIYGVPPTGKDGKKGLMMRQMLYPQMAVVGNHLEKEPGKLAKILEILDYSTANFEGFVHTRYGTEGKHFEYKDAPERGNVPVPIEPYSNWMEITKEGGGIAFNFGIWFIDICKGENSALWWKENKYPLFNEDGYVDELWIPTESFQKYSAELTTLQEQAYVSIITGDKPISYFDEFVRLWRQNGGEVIEKEMNEIN